MSRWTNLFGGSVADNLPETLQPTRGNTGDSAFEVFIEGALTNIYNAANGRHKDQRQIRETCKKIVDRLNDDAPGAPSKVSSPLSKEAAEELLEPLRLACAQDAPRLVEPALACLHKLVSHAYLQAESTPGGRLDDQTTVSQVVALVSKCGESHSEAVQLAVIRALLTITTAEHFIVHGDSLLQAVRTVFNVAIGSDSTEIQRTARSALLQMLNTVVKRVTTYNLSHRGSSQALPTHVHGDRPGSGEPASDTATPFHQTANGSVGDTAVQPQQSADSAAQGQAPGDAAELQDNTNTADPVGAQARSLVKDSARQFADEPGGDGRTAHLASLAEQADIRGLEQALDHYAGQPAPASKAAAESEVAAGESDGAGKETRRTFMREKRKSAWKQLSIPERDVLTVLAAVCKMAARETGIGAVETFMHAGKLLALDLLVKILENKAHNWANVRQEFFEQLRQPLCLALLRNCMSPYDEAFAAATKLFTAILVQPKLRGGLRAELGAFFPLLLLRPLEADRPDLAQLTAVLEALQALCSQGQIMVDLFVNYDCDLQAANLFERSVKGLSKLLRRSPPSSLFATQQTQKSRELALDAVLSILKSLDQWAEPLKEAAVEAVSGEDMAEADQEQTGHGSSNNLAGSHANGEEASEVARFGAAKEKKHSLESGISTFNRDSIKGVKALIASGSLEKSPEAIAAFLRKHIADLDKEQLGEYLGHHDGQEVSVMHAFIDGGDYRDMTIDKALRLLLKDFRLPGESQKIDRIMERFAERYCKDNPDVFKTADGAYVLSFALIMLNTDAHNPMAEKKLSVADFVGMCQYQDPEDGSYKAILPEADITQLYQRIVDTEIAVVSSGDKGDSSQTNSHNSTQNLKLAAAMGLSQLMLPFRSGAWDKQHGVDVERQRLLTQTRDLVNKGLQSEHEWHTVSHADYARPMLQVSGDAILKALQAAMDSAPSALAARSVLAGFDSAIKLSGALGLDKLTEQLVGAVAQAAGVSEPAQPGTPAEAKQVVALETLLQVASGPRAGLLGSGWVLLLRTLSALESLQVNLAGGQAGVSQAPLPPVQAPPPSIPTPRLSRQSSNITPTFTGNAHASFGVAPQPPTAEELLQPQEQAAPLASTPREPVLSKLSSSLGRFLTLPMAPAPSEEPAQPSSRTAAPAPPSVEADSNNDATRALSQRKSLRPSLARSPTVNKGPTPPEKPGAAMVAWAAGPGAGAIEQVYNCSSSLNGEAVLVFVRALCAVSQEELNPTQPSETPRVYSLQRLVDCAHQNLTRIRFIWARLWTAFAPHLVSAACHAHQRVAGFAVNALRQLATKLLLRAERAELTSFSHQDEALRPFVAVLKHCDNAVVREQVVQSIAQTITAHPRGLGTGWRSVLEVLLVAAGDHAAAVVNQALDALQPIIAALYAGVGVGHQHFLSIVTAVAACMRSPYHAELSISAVHLMQSVAKRLAASDPEVWSTTPIAMKLPFSTPSCSRRPSEAGSQEPTADAEASEHPWGVVLSQLSTVARHDPRAEVADASAAIQTEIVQAFSGQWDAATWASVVSGPFSYLFDLPKSQFAADEDPSAVVGWSVEGLQRMERQGRQHLPSLFTLLLHSYDTAGSATFQQVLTVLVRYIVESNDELMAVLGVSLLQQLAQEAVPVLDEAGWLAVADAFAKACSFESLQSLLGNGTLRSGQESLIIGSLPRSDALRYRCHSILSLQRVMAQLHSQAASSMPAQAQLHLLAVLQESVQRAAEFNYSPGSRAAAQKCLLPTAGEESPMSPLPAQAVLELSEDQAHSAAHDRQQEADELPASTPASVAGDEFGSPQRSQVSEIEPQIPNTGSDVDQIPVSSSSAVLSPMSPVPVAPLVAHPESAAAHMHDQQTDAGLLDSAIDMPTQPSPNQLHQKAEDSHGAVSDAAMLASSHAVEGLHTREKGVRTAAAAAAAALAPEVDDVMWPALMRQEAEGGVLLIDALKRSIQSGDEAVAQAAQQRLLEVCRQIITQAAQDTWHQTSHQTGSQYHGSDGTSWEQAIRAPLVVAILESYYSIHNELWTAELQAIFPHLAKLVCSAQPTVRRALGQLMHANLPYALEDLPSA